MRRARESSFSRVDRGTRSRGDGAGRAALAELGKRFSQFRKEHRRGTRFPEELREAALAALGRVPPDDLYRACSVSFRQVMAWKAAQARRAAPQDVRVFAVVDEHPVRTPEPTVLTTGQQLELRLGPWAVSVRLMDDAPARRG